MTTPLVSVVIPTHNRPQFLPRAVESALSCQGPNVEVIVVPNGSDESWKQSLAPWRNDSRVHVSPIATAHANVARNHGMEIATGEYIRFLDDDDYLLPAAARQTDLLEQAQAEICSGLLASVDCDGSPLGQVGFPETQDFVFAAVSVSGFTLPTGNLFLRTALQGCSWDAAVNRAQDNVWMIDLATVREWKWVHLAQPVGVWFQHGSERTSTVGAFTDLATLLVDRLYNLHQALLDTRRCSSTRRRAVADALWRYAHSGFPYHPLYWTHIGRHACVIDPAGKPPDPFFRSGFFKTVHPVLAEWLLLPIRRLTRAVRDARTHWRGHDYRRRL